jgi:hypothetical protein
MRVASPVALNHEVDAVRSKAGGKEFRSSSVEHALELSWRSAGFYGSGQTSTTYLG